MSKVSSFFSGKKVKAHPCGQDNQTEDKNPKKSNNALAWIGFAVAVGTVLTPMVVEEYLKSDLYQPYPKTPIEVFNSPKDILDSSFETHCITEKGDTLLTYNFLGDSTSLARTQRLVDLVMETPTGENVLKQMSENNCVLAMEYMQDGVLGYFAPDLNAICLNANFSDAQLASTLVHEAKHAQQSHSSGYSMDLGYDKASFFMVCNAMEGDAVLSQTQFAFELLADAKPDAWVALRRQQPQVTDAYLDAMIKYEKDPVMVGKETMLAWYKNKSYVKLYEDSYVGYMQHAVENNSKKDLETMFTQHIPADSIASRICSLNGIKYLGKDGAPLQDSTTFYISRQTRDALDDISKEHDSKRSSIFSVVPVKSDDSHRTFYVVEGNGKITAPNSIQAHTKVSQNKTIHFYDAVRLMQNKVSGK